MQRVYKQFVTTQGLNNVVTKCIKRELVERLDLGELHQTLRLADDALMSLYLLDAVQSLVHIDKVLYFYQNNASSTTNNARLAMLDDVNAYQCIAIPIMEKWCPELDVHAIQAQRAIRTIHRVARAVPDDTKLRRNHLLHVANHPLFRSVSKALQQNKFSVPLQCKLSFYFLQKGRLRFAYISLRTEQWIIRLISKMRRPLGRY